MDRYTEDTNNYIDIIQRYRILSENDLLAAFNLMKDSLVVYDRWSFIKANIVKELGRGEKSELKKRLDEMCKFLYEVHTDSRMIWSKAKEDLKINR